MSAVSFIANFIFLRLLFKTTLMLPVKLGQNTHGTLCLLPFLFLGIGIVIY